MNKTESSATHLGEYIAATLPRAHGHQLRAITTFVAQIIEQQTGCQAQLARGLGNHEAACKRLSRLLHNPRLQPKRLAEAVLRQAIRQLPKRGPIRLALDWTTEDDQHLLVVSLIIGRRAVPVYWRAYSACVLKGRMRRYELAVVRHALATFQRALGEGVTSGKRRLLLTADRGFADVQLFDLLNELQVAFIIRVKGSTKVCSRGPSGEQWRKLNSIGFQGNCRCSRLGRLAYCQSSPQRLFITMSRQRNRQGQWGIWYLASNRQQRAKVTASEYAHRFACEEGFRDAKWWLGFAQARICQITAWSRLFALFALALLVIASLAVELLVRPGADAWVLLKAVVSRRRGRANLSLACAMIALLQHNKDLFTHLAPTLTLDLNANSPYVS